MKVSISKKKTKNGFDYRIEARDHATGSPEVCNAVSGIMYGAAGYMSNRDDIEDRMYQLHEHGEHPEMIVQCRTIGKDEGIDAIWLFLVVSILQIEQSYPRFITVSVYMDEFPADKDADM